MKWEDEGICNLWKMKIMEGTKKMITVHEIN
jgi:hypothetical protein